MTASASSPRQNGPTYARQAEILWKSRPEEADKLDGQEVARNRRRRMDQKEPGFQVLCHGNTFTITDQHRGPISQQGMLGFSDRTQGLCIHKTKIHYQERNY